MRGCTISFSLKPVLIRSSYRPSKLVVILGTMTTTFPPRRSCPIISWTFVWRRRRNRPCSSRRSARGCVWVATRLVPGTAHNCTRFSRLRILLPEEELATARIGFLFLTCIDSAKVSDSPKTRYTWTYTTGPCSVFPPLLESDSPVDAVDNRLHSGQLRQ